MKMFKNSIIALVVSALMVGCTQVEQAVDQTTEPVEVENQQTTSEQSASSEVAETAEVETPVFPVTIENYDGEMLTISERPVRVASLILGTDEMILELIGKERIVGLSGKVADNEAVSNVAELASQFPKMENNIEVILEANPDLVVGSSWVKKELLQQLKDAGIPYYGYKTPNTIEEQKQIIKDLAKILGEEANGQEIVNDIDTRINLVVERSGQIDEEKRVRVMPYTMHGSTNAKGTIVDEVFAKAGVINAATEAGLEKRAKISKEALIDINPDAIMVLAWAKDDLNEFEAFVEDLKNDESLQDVQAIKDGKVYMASSRYMTIVSHNIVDGVEYVQETVYPELSK